MAGTGAFSTKNAIKQQVTQTDAFQLSSQVIEGRRKDINQLLNKEKVSKKATGQLQKRTATKAGNKTIPEPFNLSSSKRQKIEITQ